MVSQQTCANAYSAISRVTIGQDKVCAGDGTRDTCNGDSGGALLARYLHRDYIIGVVSFGPQKCGNGGPGYYTF